MSNITINANKIVPKNFRKVFKHIVECDLDRLVCKGGRSSAKSSVISEGIIINALNGYSSLCLIKYQNKIKERLVNQMTEAISYLGVEKYFKLRKSPFEYVLLDELGRETKTSIMFSGCENPFALKGVKPRKGSFRILWFEEADQYSKTDIEVVEESVLRGNGVHMCIMSYNPPESTSAYINKQYGNAPIGKVLGYDKNSYLEEIPYTLEDGRTITKRTLVHHSTYLDLINAGCGHFIGDALMAIIQEAKQKDERRYRHSFLGEVVGGLANVFTNIVDWQYEDLKPTTIYRGIDFSNGGSDPHCYINCCIQGRTIYFLDEIYNNEPLEHLVPSIKRLNPYNSTIFSDGAVPYFSSYLQSKGINITQAKKGADSVRAGILYLQGYELRIDPIRTPNIYRDFKELEYKVDKNGEVTTQIIGRDHGPDATRYALNEQIMLDT